MVTEQHCPICKTTVTPSPRYPRYVCQDCASRAATEDGRLLRFYNVSVSGGFMAQYAQDGAAYESHVCYIDGVKCYADEAKFGGIVIQVSG